MKRTIRVYPESANGVFPPSWYFEWVFEAPNPGVLPEIDREIPLGSLTTNIGDYKWLNGRISFRKGTSDDHVVWVKMPAPKDEFGECFRRDRKYKEVGKKP